MLQRLIVYFSVEPSRFFLTKSNRPFRDRYRQQKSDRLPDIPSGFYLEHTLVPSQRLENLEVALWRLDKSDIRFHCSGELPAIRVDRKSVFDSLDGEIGLFGKSFKLSAECTATGRGVVYTLAHIPFAPNDLLGARIVGGDGETLPQCGTTLFRYIGTSIEVADVLQNQCGRKVERDLNERSQAALATIKDKVKSVMSVTMP